MLTEGYKHSAYTCISVCFLQTRHNPLTPIRISMFCNVRMVLQLFIASFAY